MSNKSSNVERSKAKWITLHLEVPQLRLVADTLSGLGATYKAVDNEGCTEDSSRERKRGLSARLTSGVVVAAPLSKRIGNKPSTGESLKVLNQRVEADYKISEG